MTDLSRLDLIGHAELIRKREATALELLDAAIARIEAGRHLNAVICDLFERAREQAQRPLGDGPLAGAPFLLKDLGAPLAGAPERMGSVALRGYVSPHSSVVVERYEQAGLLIAGKTNTPEWGNHCTTEPILFGATINPRAPDRSCGGSSGGSAVAVAAGLVPAASGGDATGSIRVPASACGVIGLKPARGARPSLRTLGRASRVSAMSTRSPARSVTARRCWMRAQDLCRETLTRRPRRRSPGLTRSPRILRR